MKFKGRMGFEQGLKTMDIAPLINVAFLLLIFVMLGSGFVSQSAVSVSLPRAVTSEAVSRENIEVLISSENVATLSGRVVSDDELKAAFQQISRGRAAILIKADRSSSLGRAVKIWDMARSAGITRVFIATNQE
ncbi:MAG: biopolymer transporter ExbD [Candidatus Omnitrophica bacterium]|nr:biopolymer transporter ExbD [Candidatus Omnitrophota bacterium]